MKNLLFKELRLFAAPYAYLFLLAAAMVLIPGYPILISTYFLAFGVFQSFQTVRETHDLLFTALLPLPKNGIVRGKFAFSGAYLAVGLLLQAACAALRLLWQANPPYSTNPLLPPNLFFFGASLLMIALFFRVFLAGFFRTGERFGMPFVRFILVSLAVVAAAEALPHFPGLAALGSLDPQTLPLRALAAAALALLSALLIWRAYRLSCRRAAACDLH